MSRFVSTLISAALLLVLPACANTGEDGGGGDLSVTIVEPVSGATVGRSFQVKLSSGVELGPSESGRHHVHIWFDGNEEDYLIVESDTVQVTDAPVGEHTMHVSLRNANHSAAGAEASTTVIIGDGAPAQTPASTPSTADDPYDY